MTRQEIETALDSHVLQARAPNGKWYDVRRNGRTKLWKREPDRFSIPVKCGLRDCWRIENEVMNSGYYGVARPELRVRPDNFDPRKREV